MDIAITTASSIVVRGFTKGPEQIEFPRLTVGDLGELQGAIPGDARFVTLFELYRFAQTPAGADRVLLLSMRRRHPGASQRDVEQLGSLLQRVELARAIMGQSITTGEETPEDVEAESKKKGATGDETGPKSGA